MSIKTFQQFFHSEKSGGIVLVCCAILSLLLANSALGQGYLALLQTPIAAHPAIHWINDGLMAIFFLLIGLELEREVYSGQLSSLKAASLPIVAAIGGMAVPAAIHLLFNWGTPTQSGAGIPMATDIAFALGVLSLLGNRVPLSLKIFLTALAVIDDLGAILTIAFFYSSGLSWLNLGIALGIFAMLGVLNRLKVHNLIPYLIGGVAAWYFMLHSGVHATIAGVLLAFVIPFAKGDDKSVSIRLQRALHVPVSFIILPIFALANTAIVLNSGMVAGLTNSNSLGIMLGLFVGKPLGILLASFIAITAGLSAKPPGLRWRHILGLGLLGGIGFTMSIFVTLLAFDDTAVIDTSKIAIILASTVSAVVGMLLLKATLGSKR